MPEAASQPDARPRKRRRTLLFVGLIVAVLLIGGAAAAFVLLKGSSEKLLDKIPAGSDMVFTAYLDPSAGQKVNLLRLASHFPTLNSPQHVQDEVNKALDSVLRGSGLDHTDASWVGSEIALTVDLNASAPPAVAVLIVSSDDAAAKKSLDKLRGGPSGNALQWSTEDHGGVTISVGTGSSPDAGTAYALFDGIVVIGSKQAVEGVVDASQGKIAQLATSADFVQTMSDLPTGRLGFFYMNPGPIVGMLEQSPAFQAASVGAAAGDLKAMKGIAVTLSAEPDGIALESSVRYDPAKLSAEAVAQRSTPGHANPLIKMVPQDAYGFLGAENIDEAISSALDQAGQGSSVPGASDLIAALSGDLAIEAGPSGGSQGGALLLGSKDDAVMKTALDSVAAFIPDFAGGTGGWTTLEYHGVTIRYLSLSGAVTGVAPAYAVIKGAAVIATSPDEMKAIIDAADGGANIASSPAFVTAMKDVPSGGASTFYFDIQGIVTAVRANLPSDALSSFNQGAGQYLDPIRTIASGSRKDASRDHSRIFVRIQ